MKLIKYQGASLVSAHAGDTVELEELLPGVSWTVTEQGHLECDVAEDNSAALELISVGFAQKQE